VLLFCQCREIVPGVTQLFQGPSLGIFSSGQKPEGTLWILVVALSLLFSSFAVVLEVLLGSTVSVN